MLFVPFLTTSDKKKIKKVADSVMNCLIEKAISKISPLKTIKFPRSSPVLERIQKIPAHHAIKAQRIIWFVMSVQI